MGRAGLNRNSTLKRWIHTELQQTVVHSFYRPKAGVLGVLPAILTILDSTAQCAIGGATNINPLWPDVDRARDRTPPVR
jgi:hypothetical protein